MDKIITKDSLIVVAVAVFMMMVHSNYFATKLDLANVKLELNELKVDLMSYSDKGDKELAVNIDKNYKEIVNNYKEINAKLEKLR